MLKRDVRYALGIETDMQSQSMVFIQAPIESIERVIGDLYMGEYHHNIYEQAVPGQGFLVFQFVGQGWTIICGSKADDSIFSKNFRSEALSKLLENRVFNYRNVVEFDEDLQEPCRTEFGYQIYESGKLVEQLNFNGPGDCTAYPKWVWHRIISSGAYHCFDHRVREERIFVPHYRFHVDASELSLVPGDILQIAEPYTHPNDGIFSIDMTNLNTMLEPVPLYQIRPHTDFVGVGFFCLKEPDRDGQAI